MTAGSGFSAPRAGSCLPCLFLQVVVAKSSLSLPGTSWGGGFCFFRDGNTGLQRDK